MRRLRFFLLLFFICLFNVQFVCFADEINPSAFFTPMLSYETVSFDGIVFHNPMGGLSFTRVNSATKNLFSVTAMYSATIADGIENNYPSLYHSIALAFNGKAGRHTGLGAVTAQTDEPFYGGLHTFNAVAGYTYDLINGAHFSMDLGVYLMFMDINAKLPDGTPWFVWPLPAIALKWDYEWVDISVFPGVKVTIADGKAVSFVVSKRSDDFDLSLWYHYYGNRQSKFEILGIGAGLKNAASQVKTAAGDVYEINYYALYGSLRILKLIELHGGWAFDGKERYGKINWGNLFEMYGYSDELDYKAEIGNGFFFTISARFIF
jgi:hypothetical protein